MIQAMICGFVSMSGAGTRLLRADLHEPAV